MKMSRVCLVALAAVIAAGSPTLPPAQVCEGIAPVPGAPVTTVRVAAGLALPTLAVAPPGDAQRLFIVEQAGRILILRDGVLLATPFLDISGITRSPASGGGNEEGLLSLAFHPDYASNGWFFVYHTNSSGNSNQVARYSRSAVNADRADAASRELVLGISHPNYANHNGGMIAFSPADGNLYIGTGDGGFRCDPDDNGLDDTSLLGKMLRINVDALPYTIPADNPFAAMGGQALDEIWALGLRNPWRWSFDDNGDLYIADVGQDKWEEVNHQPVSSPGGENYGWARYEADECPVFQCSAGNCNLQGHVPPVTRYSHSEGCSITGGFVYRGCRMPDLHGTYFYADYCAGFVRSFTMAGGVPTEPLDWTVALRPAGGLSLSELTAFGRDGRGELYLLDRGSGSGGELFMMVPVLSALEVSGVGATPLLLTEDGAAAWSWEDLAATTPYSGLTYRVYRAPAPSGEVFSCIHEQPSTSWSLFDATLPAEGQVLAYLVTAHDGNGNETSPGRGSGGQPRQLSGAACP